MNVIRKAGGARPGRPAGGEAEGARIGRPTGAVLEEGEVPEEQGDRDKTRYNAAYLIPCLVLALSLIAAGLFPDLINSWLSSAAHACR